MGQFSARPCISRLNPSISSATSARLRPKNGCKRPWSVQDNVSSQAELTETHYPLNPMRVLFASAENQHWGTWGSENRDHSSSIPTLHHFHQLRFSQHQPWFSHSLTTNPHEHAFLISRLYHVFSSSNKLLHRAGPTQMRILGSSTISQSVCFFGFW